MPLTSPICAPRLWPLLVLGAVLLPALTASAQPNHSIEEVEESLPPLRIGFETFMAGMVRETRGTGSRWDPSETTTAIAFANEGLGVSISAKLIPFLSIGVDGRVGLLSRPGDDATSTFTWEVSPFFEARFLVTGPVIPYLQAGGLFRGTIESPDGYDRTTERFVGCRFGLGLHIFVSESVSISPRLEMEYLTGLGDENPVTHRWRAGLGLGIQFWLGNTASSSSESAPSTNATERHRRQVVPPPQVATAQANGHVNAARLVLHTANTRLTFTFDPNQSTERVQGQLQSTTRTALACDSFEMDSGSVRGRSPIRNGRFEIPLEALIQAGRAERAFARFCGRSWMNRPEDARAIQQFGQRAREALANRRPTDANASPHQAVQVVAQPATEEPANHAHSLRTLSESPSPVE